MGYELLIHHENKMFMPVIEEGIQWSTERMGSPGELKFKVITNGPLQFEEGDMVRFKRNEKKIFCGFVFSIKTDKDLVYDITAYDQLRYFKNKDTYVYENKTAGEFIRMLANDFNLQTGELEDTGFKIASRVEENMTLFDMVQSALDITIVNKKKMYVLYDDFGKLCLRNIANQKVDLLFEEETSENFDYSSSIDANTYNKIKLTRDNEKIKKKEIYIIQHGENINKWGVLQYFDTLQDGENGKEKAAALLSLYNRKTKNLSIKNAIGDYRVRAGCMVPVKLDIGDVKIQNYMLVEKAKHEFKGNEHWMDLTLRGGDYIA